MRIAFWVLSAFRMLAISVVVTFMVVAIVGVTFWVLVAIAFRMLAIGMVVAIASSVIVSAGLGIAIGRLLGSSISFGSFFTTATTGSKAQNGNKAQGGQHGKKRLKCF